MDSIYYDCVRSSTNFLTQARRAGEFATYAQSVRGFVDFRIGAKGGSPANFRLVSDRKPNDFIFGYSSF